MHKISPFSFRPALAKATYLFVVLFLCGMKYSSAQSEIKLINLNIVQPEKAIMYAGVINTLLLKGEIPDKSIRIERSSGPVEMRAGTAIRTKLFYTSEGTDTLRVYIDENLILEKVYIIKPLGKAVASLKNNRDTVLSPADIIAAGEPEVYFSDCLYKPVNILHGYRVELQNAKGKKMKSFEIKERKFNEELNTVLLKTESGSKLVFSQIKVELSKEQVLPLDPFTLYLK